MAVTGIDYEEMRPGTYKAVTLLYGKDQRKRFETGDFVRDWYDCVKFELTELAGKEHAFAISSSVDHFIMDGAEFDRRYLVVVDDEAELVEGDEGVMFFVGRGKDYSWAEFRERCCDKIKENGKD